MSSIGVFDSGVGGLSILKTLVEKFPHESFIYLGDTARLPYGTKSKSTIISYVNRNLNYLLKNHDIKAVVVACNSASSVLSEINSSVPTIGVIEAGAKSALNSTKNNIISLWATRTTVELGQYSKYITENATLNSTPCPLLVSLVEEGLEESRIAETMFEHYLKPVIKSNSDTLILGCTHFPFLKEVLTKYLDKLNISLNLTDASAEISNELKENIISSKKDTQKIQILLTDGAQNFKDFTASHLPDKLTFDFSMIEI